jgi:hypothetical protein
MAKFYIRMRARARHIVSRYPPPDFYTDLSRAFSVSRHIFDTHPTVSDLRFHVTGRLEEDFGHGLQHATKVALDAGTLMIAEGERIGWTTRATHRCVVTVHCASLLHDIKRKEPDHAVKGSAYAAVLLKQFPFSIEEREDIRLAIHDHEAFKKRVPVNSRRGALVSDCLYDADKFRWGPDNFTDTLWCMVFYQNPPLENFLASYPKGLSSLQRVRNTFRTVTGSRYGPQFIDMGISIGEELLKVIETEFRPK